MMKISSAFLRGEKDMNLLFKTAAIDADGKGQSIMPIMITSIQTAKKIARIITHAPPIRNIKNDSSKESEINGIKESKTGCRYGVG